MAAEGNFTWGGEAELIKRIEKPDVEVTVCLGPMPP